MVERNQKRVRLSRRGGDGYLGSFDRTIADVDGSVGPTDGGEKEGDGRAERADRDIVEVRNGGEVDNTARYPGGT